jgi:hypothetical protein
VKDIPPVHFIAVFDDTTVAVLLLAARHRSPTGPLQFHAVNAKHFAVFRDGPIAFRHAYESKFLV